MIINPYDYRVAQYMTPAMVLLSALNQNPYAMVISMDGQTVEAWRLEAAEMTMMALRLQAMNGGSLT